VAGEEVDNGRPTGATHNISSRRRLYLNSRRNKLWQYTNWPAAWTSEGPSGLASRDSTELAQIWAGSHGRAGQADQGCAREEELGPNGGELRARIHDGGKAAARLTRQRGARGSEENTKRSRSIRFGNFSGRVGYEFKGVYFIIGMAQLVLYSTKQVKNELAQGSLRSSLQPNINLKNL
jgi:hypothetical protein